jgi:tRNA threonylcarbamoyladenosine biosynthesis protein TsaE
MKHISQSPAETQKIAHNLARELVKKYKGKTVIIALKGELGAGKTTFVQSFANALGVARNIKSPTFVLMKHYHLHDVPGYTTLYHLDCYRLQNPNDLAPLGVEDILKQSGNIVLIEWAERIAKILPKDCLVIEMEHLTEQERNISIHDH